jgi:hypothetical protein
MPLSNSMTMRPLHDQLLVRAADQRPDRSRSRLLRQRQDFNVFNLFKVVGLRMWNLKFGECGCIRGMHRIDV